MCLWYQRGTNWPITETNSLKLGGQFIRISVEIFINAPRFGIRKAGRTLAFENCSLNMHIGTYVRRQKPPEMQGRCTARSGAHSGESSDAVPNPGLQKKEAVMEAPVPDARLRIWSIARLVAIRRVHEPKVASVSNRVRALYIRQKVSIVKSSATPRSRTICTPRGRNSYRIPCRNTVS